MNDMLTSLSMSRDMRIFRQSPHSGPEETLRYDLALPIQIAPGKALMILGTEVIRGRALDYVGGADGLIFDNLDALNETNAFPLVRNERRNNPLNDEPCLIMKFFPAIGFVPLGAKRFDGSPHPAAGTGFGLLYHQSMPLDMSDREAFSGTWAQRDDIYRSWELLQFHFDGERFEITGRQMFSHADILPGHTLIGRSISVAVGDDDDLLLPIQAISGQGDPHQMCGFAEIPSGVSRWRYGTSGWRPVDYVSVTGDINAFEPSMVRDTDGSLLFTARQTGKDILEKFDIFVWRSIDNGKSWELLFRAARVRAATPVTINLTGDGRPFIAGNLLTTTLFTPPGAVGNYGYSREFLALWELTDDRRWIKSPSIPRAARTEFGMPPSTAGWRIDHPLSNVVRLADGKRHAFLSYRVMGVGEGCAAMNMTEHTGCYVTEISGYDPA